MSGIIVDAAEPFYPMFAVKFDLLYVANEPLTRFGEEPSRLRPLNMKIALKYGMAVALVIAAWVTLKNFVLHFVGPAAQGADFVIFNLSAIVALFLGIREKRALNGGSLSFVDGLGTGALIAITYSLLVCLYFAVLLLLTGPGVMQKAGHTSYVSAFGGLFIGLAFFGTIFSAVISVILKRS